MSNKGDTFVAAIASFREKYGPWAVVTGAASGLGQEFTNQLASHQINIIAIDLQAEKLREQVAFLTKQHGIQARELVVDLAAPGFLETIKQATIDLEVGLVANVAGISYVGPLLDLPLDALQRQ